MGYSLLPLFPLNSFFKMLICLLVLQLFSQVPHVTRTDYQLIDISEDGFVSYSFNLYKIMAYGIILLCVY